MLPLLTFLGLAFVAGLWPDGSSDTNQGPDTASGDLNASGTSTGEAENPESPLNYAAAEPEEATETLSASESEVRQAAKPAITGTDGIDVLFGDEADDMIVGGAGADTLFGLDGDDWLVGDDDAEGDELIGGDDNDQLFLGAGDTGTGGSGDDWFHLGKDAEDVVVITDFNADDDDVMVYYDATGPEPELDIDQTQEGARLWIDKQLLAVFPGASQLPIGNVHLLPEPQAA